MGRKLVIDVGNATLSLWILYICFVTDLLLFGVNIARSTYLSKIAITPEHISPTLAMGITIDHTVSMSLPILGGVIWMKFGHPYVFMFAGGVAVLMLLFSNMVRVEQA